MSKMFWNIYINLLIYWFADKFCSAVINSKMYIMPILYSIVFAFICLNIILRIIRTNLSTCPVPYHECAIVTNKLPNINLNIMLMNVRIVIQTKTRSYFYLITGRWLSAVYKNQYNIITCYTFSDKLQYMLLNVYNIYHYNYS